MSTPDVRVLVDLEHDMNPPVAPLPEPTWTDISSYLRAPPSGNGFAITRGRSRETDRVEAGRAVGDFDNSDSAFLPVNTDSPLYPFLPDRRIRYIGLPSTGLEPFRTRTSRNRGGHVQRGATQAEETLFDGIISAIELDYPGRGTDAIARISAVDLLSPLSEDEADVVLTAQTSDERIASLLDEAAYTSDREIELSESNVQAMTHVADNLRQELSRVEATEGGLLFVSRSGVFTFYARSHRLLPADARLRFSSEVVDEPFVDVKFRFDRSLIRNIITVSAPGETDVVATDPDSIRAHFDRPFELDTIAADPGQMAATADEYLARYSSPFLLVRELDLSDITDDWPLVLRQDLWSRILLTVRFPDGLELEQLSLIEGIAIASPRRSRWSVVWQLSALEYPNLLSANQSSMETDVSEWIAESNCTIDQATIGEMLGTPAVVAAIALAGESSLALLPTADGVDVSALTEPETAIEVVPTVRYQARAHFNKTAFLFSQPDGYRVDIVWLDIGESVISTTTGTVEPVFNRWVAAIATGIAPAGAAFARLRVTIVGHDNTGNPFDAVYFVDLVRLSRVG